MLKSSDSQFGFKAQHSTNLCTFVLNEIVQYYRNKNTNVHGIFLDESKAFDKVHYTRIFKLLIRKGLGSIVIRLLVQSASLCKSDGTIPIQIIQCV